MVEIRLQVGDSSLRRHYPDQVCESKALGPTHGAVPRLSSQLGNTKLPGLSRHLKPPAAETSTRGASRVSRGPSAGRRVETAPRMAVVQRRRPRIRRKRSSSSWHSSAARTSAAVDTECNSARRRGNAPDTGRGRRGGGDVKFRHGTTVAHSDRSFQDDLNRGCLRCYLALVKPKVYDSKYEDGDHSSDEDAPVAAIEGGAGREHHCDPERVDAGSKADRA